MWSSGSLDSGSLVLWPLRPKIKSPQAPHGGFLETQLTVSPLFLPGKHVEVGAGARKGKSMLPLALWYRVLLDHAGFVDSNQILLIFFLASI